MLRAKEDEIEGNPAEDMRVKWREVEYSLMHVTSKKFLRPEAKSFSGQFWPSGQNGRERRGKGRWGGGRRRKVYSGANAVNEEDPERDRVAQEEEDLFTIR